MAATTSWILSEGYAGLQAQALGLAEAAGLCPETRTLMPRAPWRWVAASVWPSPLKAVPEAVQPPFPDLVLACGGVGAAVGAALRRADPASAHGPKPVRSCGGEPARRADRPERPGDADRPAPGHASPACESRRGVAAALRAPQAPAGRRADRWQQRPVSPGRIRWGRACHAACGNDPSGWCWPGRYPVAPH